MLVTEKGLFRPNFNYLAGCRKKKGKWQSHADLKHIINISLTFEMQVVDLS